MTKSSNRLRHPAEDTADQAGAPARLRRRIGRLVRGDAALIKIIQEYDVVRLSDGKVLGTDEYRVVVEERADEWRGGRGGPVLRDHELRWLEPMRDHGLLEIRQLANELGGEPADGRLQCNRHRYPRADVRASMARNRLPVLVWSKVPWVQAGLRPTKKPALPPAFVSCI